ncbi:MAG: hypothetical protein IPP47_06935 [Bryobacterales bacterium]|nr:hypothetical protein [Bryobacterales bacterium]
MLTLIGGEAAHRAVTSFSRALRGLYTRGAALPEGVEAHRLAQKAKEAVTALSSWAIRHGVDDLPLERESFGSREEWNIVVPAARVEELEAMLLMDRALRIAKQSGSAVPNVTNDPRFHVGWRQFDATRESLSAEAQRIPEPARSVVLNQLHNIKRLRTPPTSHSKIEAVAAAVESIIQQGEKVLLFCHHHATAQELTIRLAEVLPKLPAPRAPSLAAWKRAWGEVVCRQDEREDEEQLRSTFIDWLCSDLIRAQTLSWLGTKSPADARLRDLLERQRGRHPLGGETIAKAAVRLYRTLLQSKSSAAVLKAAAAGRSELLAGSSGSSRVLGVCLPDEDRRSLFIHNQQPDTVISIFNSPFGPDVLVVTDKLSEGSTCTGTADT